ncbi:MAG: EAL domain-containing protein [Woeseia sp.]|nr:EAL domain-containing protein [Woeseia sp.]NNE59726.1 EAL domain-containing protein [Woeseia sp.]NNL54751.1 EAL domain-containing protein [Woeseia sp.]
MAEYTVLYLGRPAFAADYLQHLEQQPYCRRVYRCNELIAVEDMPRDVDIVLFQAGPDALLIGHALKDMQRAFSTRPFVALTDREHEHRGVAAARAGAQGYICIDDFGDAEQLALFNHVVQRHHLQARLSEADDTVLSILKSINDGALVVDRDGNLLDINPAARTILGLPQRGIPNGDWASSFCALSADGRTPLDAEMTPLYKARKGEKFSDLLAVHRIPQQTDTVLSINGQGLYDAHQQLIGGVITFRDVTEVMNKTLALEKRAEYDELTMLPNRRLFTRQLEKAMGRAQRSKRPLAVLFIDLDRFKSVNDTLGHDSGDELLRQVADRMQRRLRIGDFLGRWGGDEFVACLEDFGDGSDAAAAAQKLVLALSENYNVNGSEVYATPSVGISLFPESGETAERLIKAADMAMYQAKRRGGGRYQYYSKALNERLEQREELELGLRHALVRNEFALHYQPRVDVRTGRLIGLEALLRWQHPRFGLLQPGRFLTILETSGLIHSAGEWIIDTACRQLAGWQRQFDMPDLSISINLSSQQLLHGRLVAAVEKVLADTGLDSGCIEFEINGGDIAGRRASERGVLDDLRKLGVRLSLHNFGTRDVSFRSLDTGVIDSFVLDPSLIQDVDINGSHQRIVRAAIAMARGLNIEVAAEGVETITQFEFLKSCDCTLAQGFLISKPMQAEQVSSILRAEAAGAYLMARA